MESPCVALFKDDILKPQINKTSNTRRYNIIVSYIFRYFWVKILFKIKILFKNICRFTELNTLVASTNRIASVFLSFKMLCMPLIAASQLVSHYWYRKVSSIFFRKPPTPIALKPGFLTEQNGGRTCLWLRGPSRIFI